MGVTSIALVLGGIYGYIQINKEKERKMLESSIVDLYQIPGREKIFMNGKLLPLKSQKLSVNAEQGDKYYVYKVENEIAKKVEIKVKEKKDYYYLVDSGVKDNDEIIKDVFSSDIEDGEKVYTGKNELE